MSKAVVGLRPSKQGRIHGATKPAGAALGRQPGLSEPRVRAAKDSSLVPGLLNLKGGQARTG